MRPETPVRNYRELLVWQKGIALVKQAYALTELFPRSDKFGLVGQIRRAAVSVPSNVVEGQARGHTKEFVQFLHVALGSLAELDTELAVARELGYGTDGRLRRAGEQVLELRNMIYGLISKLAGRP